MHDESALPRLAALELVAKLQCPEGAGARAFRSHDPCHARARIKSMTVTVIDNHQMVKAYYYDIFSNLVISCYINIILSSYIMTSYGIIYHEKIHPTSFSQAVATRSAEGCGPSTTQRAASAGAQQAVGSLPGGAPRRLPSRGAVAGGLRRPGRAKKALKLETPYIIMPETESVASKDEDNKHT